MRSPRPGEHWRSDRHREIHDEVREMSAPARSFYAMVAISTTIAAYGLLANSTAVVIGAMLVAPLMGPIFGIALGLAMGDRRLLRNALLSEVMGTALAIALAALVGLAPLRMDFGTEIMARTQPTLYDLIIAVAAGLAGAYALVNERISPALPGVAIAVAVVPPLATCGLCVAAAQWSHALGAFLLFLANVLAIELASAFVFIAFGMTGLRLKDRLDFGDVIRRFGVSLAALLLITVFMTQTLASLIRDRTLSRALESALAAEVGAASGAQLSDFRYEKKQAALEVIATVLTPLEFEPAQVARIEDALKSQVDPRMYLIVRSLLSKDGDRSGPVFIAGEELQRRAEAAAESEYLSRVTHALTAGLQPLPGARLADLRHELEMGLSVITAVVEAPAAITPDEVADLEDAVRRAVGTPLHLIVRSVITHDADAHRYLYEPQQIPRPLTGEDLALHERLRSALRNQIAQQVPGAVLLEARHADRDGRLLLLGVVRTPRSLEPHEVKEIEDNLRRHVRPNLDLVISSQVGGYTAPTGYLKTFDESKLSP